MVHTAIIAFGLIFLMFFLKECGNKEIKVKENKEIKISQEESSLNNTKTSIKDVKLILNDKEKHQVVMDVVSQIELENKSVMKMEQISLKDKLIKEIRPELKIELTALAKAEAEKLALAKAEAEKLALAKAEEEKVALAKAEISTPSEDMNTKENIEIAMLMAQPKITDETKALQKENSQLKEKINKLLEIAKKATTQAKLEDNITSQKIQSIMAQNSDLRLLLKDATSTAKEATKEIQLLKGLKSNLTTELEKEKLLAEENNNLKNKIAELLSIAEKATATAIFEHDNESQEMQGLLSNQKDLESNLTAELEKEKLLTEENNNLTTKITGLLSMVEKEKSLEENLSITLEETQAKLKTLESKKSEEMQGLLSNQKDLESNLTAELEKEKLLTEENNNLKNKIAELLSIAEKATATATVEHDKDVKEMQGLLSQNKELKENSKKEVFDLNAKIAELLLIAQRATEVATVEHDEDMKEMQGLLSQTKYLESNLTAELEKEKFLEEQNSNLKGKVTELLSVVEKEKSIEENLTKTLEETQAKIETLEAEKDAISQKNEEMQGLLSNQKDLESNLTAELEKEKLLKEENDNLTTKITGLLSMVEKEKSLEENLSTTLEETQAKLKILEAEQAAAQKAEEERLAKEKEEAEQAAAQKAEEERLAKEKEEAEQAAAQKAEEERLAKEKIILDTFALTKVEFKYNSMQLTTKSKKLLNNVASTMKEHSNYHYNIQGHTDNRGKDEYNLKLSAKRAEKVKEYLVSKGVDSSILTTEGLGSLQPIASNDTKAGRLLNRRVVFEIVK